MSWRNASLVFEAAEAGGASGSAVFGVVLGELEGLFSVERRSIEPQLYVLSALLGLELVLLGGSLWTRFRLGRVWWWRWTETKLGFYLTPHFNLPWQTVTVFFLIVLQSDVWCLWRMSKGHRFRGFYFVEPVVWCGFWLASLVCTWSVAMSRAIQVCASATHLRPAWYYRPSFVHAIFVGYCSIVILATFSWAGVTESRYQHLNTAVDAALATLATAAAAAASAASSSSAPDATQLAASVAAVQGAMDALAGFMWVWEATFWSGMAHNVTTWVICDAVALPFLGRMWVRLFRPADGRVLAPAERQALRWALVTASTTVFVINLACIAYAILVLLAVRRAAPLRFIPLAYRCGLAAVWTFAAVGLLVSSVALLRSLLQSRDERREHAPVAARAQAQAQAWDSSATRGDGPEAGALSEAGGQRRRTKLERMLGQPAGVGEERFVVTMSRMGEGDEEGVEGERVELAMVGKEGWDR